MHISIVGGGWVGCHLASVLMQENSVTLYEKNDRLFTETSYNNQNRLHLGYHYARSFNTRELCSSTHSRFMQQYGDFTAEVPNNYYCIPADSNIDFKTYLQIFDLLKIENQCKVETDFLTNIEGSIQTKERYIDFHKLHNLFNDTLQQITVKKTVNDMSEVSGDLIINCTNNQLNPIQDAYYELTLTLLYERVRDIPFGAITLVDGNFFSIYPYKDNCYTVTDVEHTPIRTFRNLDELRTYSLAPEVLEDKIKLIERKVLSYYPDFASDFSYKGYFISTKSKSINYSANRYPVIRQNKNTISCYTGKIQGIYIIEDYVRKCLSHN